MLERGREWAAEEQPHREDTAEVVETQVFHARLLGYEGAATQAGPGARRQTDSRDQTRTRDGARQKETPLGPSEGRQGRKKKSGDDLLSHAVTRAVPSAPEGLTSVFGMGTGVTPPIQSPEKR